MIEAGQRVSMKKPTLDQFVDMSLISRVAVDEQQSIMSDLQEQSGVRGGCGVAVKEISASTEYKVY